MLIILQKNYKKKKRNGSPLKDFYGCAVRLYQKDNYGNDSIGKN